MERNLFELRFTVKQLTKQSKKSLRDSKATRTQIKRAIEDQDFERARIYAQTAIRQHNQSLQFLRLASRIEAVATQLEYGIRMRQVSKQMARTVKAITRVSKTMNLEKMTQIMDQFESVSAGTDARAEVLMGAVDSAMGDLTPATDVDRLVAEVAEEHGLELNTELSQAAPSQRVHSSVGAGDQAETVDSLEAGLP